MQHLDPDRLVLLALGEGSVDDVESAHLVDCTGCRREIDDLRHVVELSTETQEVRDLPPPPDRVWRRIAAEVEALPPAPGASAAEARSAGGAGATVVDLGDAKARRAGRRRSTWVRPLMASAAAAVLGVVGTVVVFQAMDRGTTESPPSEQVVARADLAPLPDAPAGIAGNARVLTNGGNEQLHLHVTGLPLSTGYQEVWLINPVTNRMISVGVLSRETDVLLPLPDTVDLNQYSVVDVSQERYDGKVEHSGVSYLRGQLGS